MRPFRRGFPAGSRKYARRLAAKSIVAAAAAALLGPSWADTPEAAQNEIRSALEGWQSAFNEYDQNRICDLFAPDLVANYQGQPERDYASLCQLLQTSLQDTQSSYHYS